MCIMCLEFANERMSMFEVRKALTELVETNDDPEQLKHYKELAEMTDEELANHANEMAKNEA